MAKPKLRELGEAVRSLFGRPYTIRFPKAPSVPFEAFRGKPEFDDDECVGCGACHEVCPAKAIDLEERPDERKRTLTLHLDRCIFCGQCELNCITEKGITLTAQYDLATFNREELKETVEKALVLCEVCSAVVGTHDHLKWLADRLGEAAFSNPTVYLASMKELGVVDEVPAGGPQSLVRPDRIRILCPKCRKATTLEL